MENTIRIYGKRKEIASDYYEVEYTEYRENGTIKQTGTEDFSGSRWNKVLCHWVWTWDGVKFNKGGKRWFECRCLMYHTGTPKQVINVLRATRYTCPVIQLR